MVCHLTLQIVFTPTKDVRTYNTRSFSASNFYINCSQLSHNKNSFSIKGTNIWNAIPEAMRQLQKYRCKKIITESFFQIFLKQDYYLLFIYVLVASLAFTSTILPLACNNCVTVSPQKVTGDHAASHIFLSLG